MGRSCQPNVVGRVCQSGSDLRARRYCNRNTLLSMTTSDSLDVKNWRFSGAWRLDFGALPALLVNFITKLNKKWVADVTRM